MLGRSVLVTGSSGFIGGVLHRRFQELGFDTVGIGRRKIDLPGYISHDLQDPLPEGFGPFDVVVHAAARSSPWGSRHQFEVNNVEATRRLLDYCRLHGRPRFVFISSSSVYYRPGHQFDITETDPPAEKPVNRYAASKIQAEALVREYPGPWVILRPRAVFGPGDTVLFPRILAAARAGRLPRLVSPDRPAVGDLIYIDNLIDMIVEAATRDDILGEFNLTNDQPIEIMGLLLDIFSRLSIPKPTRQVSTRSAMRFAALLEGIYGLLMPWREPPITRFGVHVFAYSKTFDVTKMLNTFGRPKVSIETGVERLVDWIQSQNNEGN
ncbi:MAG: NAD(P)-dependent oxidoreductase [Planctomycetia bacterium]|jgi:nucleoside-diphosphate-sugar epimerase